MRIILEYSSFLKNYTISKINDRDILSVINLCYEVFSSHCSKEEMFDYLIKSVDWGISIKATVGDKIVGCYLLSQEPISSCDSVDDERIKYYSNLYGLQGISLAVSNEYRNMGIGKALRDETLNMGYDYIWGYQSKELNNIDNWVKFGRKIVGETYFDYITLMDLRVDAQIDESYIYLNDGIFIPSFKS